MNKHARIALNDTSGVDNEHVESVFESLKDRGKIQRNYATAYININSIRYKFDEIRELLNDKIFDLISDRNKTGPSIQRQPVPS